MRRLLTLVLIVSLFGAASGCSSRSSHAPDHYGATAGGPMPAASGAPGGPAAGAQTEPTPASQIPPQRKLILKAAILLQVEDVQKAFDRIRELVVRSGGYVAASSLSEPSAEERSAQLELRIPADRAASSVDQIAAFGKLRSRTESGEDVTEQYVDMESRVRNLQREEERLLELLRHADKVKDLLEVEKEVTRVRGEIEQIQGRLKHMDQLVAYATVTVTLSAHPVVAPTVPTSFWNLEETVSYAWYATLVIVRAMLQTTIYALFMLPFGLLLWALVRRAARPARFRTDSPDQ